jgi:hypothetical protein
MPETLPAVFPKMQKPFLSVLFPKWPLKYAATSGHSETLHTAHNF